MKKYKVVTAGLLLAGLIATGITWAAGQSNGEKNAQWRKPLNESITLRFGEKPIAWICMIIPRLTTC